MAWPCRKTYVLYEHGGFRFHVSEWECNCKAVRVWDGTPLAIEARGPSGLDVAPLPTGATVGHNGA